jgi:undecaprenyl-diphosphatase
MALDRQLFLWVQSLTGNPVLDQAMVFLAEYLVMLVPLSLIYMWYRDREVSLFSFYTAVTGIALSYGLGLIYAHSNPSAFFDTIVSYAPENSFPSQHTTAIIATALPLLYQDKEELGALLLVSGLLTGFARVYIGEHWPMDILGAVIAATSGLLICISTWPWLERFWRPLIDYSREIEEYLFDKF